jgi:hypothetical protein
VNYVCCEVEVSATGRSHVQGNPTKSVCVCVCVIKSDQAENSPAYEEYLEEAGIKKSVLERKQLLFS